MTDPTSAPADRQTGDSPTAGDPASAAPESPSSYLERWQPTSTVQMLRTFMLVAEQVYPALARRADLSQSEVRVLELLLRDEHGPVELSRALGVTSAAAVGIVDRLTAHGHVVREPHPTDGRRTRVTLTPAGRDEVLGQLLPMFLAIDEMDRALPEEHRPIVEGYLRGAIDAIRRVT